jgi:hypothetical protein
MTIPLIFDAENDLEEDEGSGFNAGFAFDYGVFFFGFPAWRWARLRELLYYLFISSLVIEFATTVYTTPMIS